MNYSNTTMKSLLKYLLLFLWAALIMVTYIMYSGTTSHIYGSFASDWHLFFEKLSKIDFPSYFANLLLAFLGTLLFTIAATSSGLFFLNKHYQNNNISDNDWYGILITAFLLGEIIFSILLLSFAAAEILTPMASFIIIFLGGLLGIKSTMKFASTLPKGSSILPIIKGDRKTNLIFWLSTLVIASTVLFTAARLSYDSTAFYFSDAKIMAMTHRIFFFPNDSFVISSFHTGILYTAIIQLFGDQGARLFSWINGIFLILLSFTLADKVGLTPKGKVFLFALLSTSTALIDLFGDGKIELSASLPSLTAVYWLLKTKDNTHSSAYLLAGIFIGFAMITRPYNLVLLGVFTGLYIFSDKSNFKLLHKSIPWIAAPILLSTIIHLAVNWIELGNPFAPINNTFVVTKDVWQWSFNPEQIWAIRALYPLVATFINTAQSLGNISPLIIIFMPVFLLKQSGLNTNLNNSLKKIFLIAIFTLAAWIISYFTVLEIRYVLFLWIIIYIAFAERISLNLEQTGTVNKTISQCILITLLLFIFIRNIFIAVDAYAPINKSGIPQCGDFIFCNFLKPINEAAKPGERVLTLNAYRYYLRPELFACSSKNTDYVKIRGASLVSNEAFWIEVHRQGYTYIAYERNYAVRHLYMNFSPNPENTPSWVQLNQLEDDMDGSFVSYKIKYINPPYKAEKQCSQNSGVWLVENIP